MKPSVISRYFAWIQAAVAMGGSLYFSEVAKFNPCKLCWYQRITMYPLVLIIGVGILRKDKNLPYYVLPLSLTGLIISLYHNLIYYHLISENFIPCGINDVSCTTKFFSWFGFITIPLLSLVAHTVITGLMVLTIYFQKQGK